MFVKKTFVNMLVERIRLGLALTQKNRSGRHPKHTHLFNRADARLNGFLCVFLCPLSYNKPLRFVCQAINSSRCNYIYDTTLTPLYFP